MSSPSPSLGRSRLPRPRMLGITAAAPGPGVAAARLDFGPKEKKKRIEGYIRRLFCLRKPVLPSIFPGIDIKLTRVGLGNGPAVEAACSLLLFGISSSSNVDDDVGRCHVVRRRVWAFAGVAFSCGLVSGYVCVRVSVCIV